VKNHQIPSLFQYAEYIALKMRALSFGWQQIAGHGIVSTGDKGVPYDTAKFTGNKDSHL
jgi:hypothetical protein